MRCKKCSNLLGSGEVFCGNCGEKIVPCENSSYDVTNDSVEHVNAEIHVDYFKKIGDFCNKYKKVFLLLLIISLLSFVGYNVFRYLTKEDRLDILMSLEESDKLKFVVGDKKYYLGQNVSTLNNKGLSYDTTRISENDYVLSDSITINPFYSEEKALFLGALYCPKRENCKYNDAILIKANFYKKSNVIIDDFLKIGLSYDEVKEEYGKEDGKFYQDNSFLVWSFKEEGKIGNPYYLIKFNSKEKVEEIRIGVWWYEDEFSNTVD